MRDYWNRAYRVEYGAKLLKIQEDLPQLAKKWKKEGIKRILDLGCGNGRHLIYLAQMDFDVYGFDVSNEAVELAKKYLKEKKLKANIKVGDMFKKLPYKDDFFDVVICTRTLNHGKIGQIRKVIREMYRVLKPNGYVFATTHKHRGKKHIPKDKLYGIKWIGPRTYVILGGPEKGVIHYRFNKKILIEEFKKAKFKISKFWIDSKSYYCLLGRKIKG